MRRALRLLGVLLLVVTLALAGLLAYGQFTFKRRHKGLIVREIPPNRSAAALARGEYLVRSVAECGECHSPEGRLGGDPNAPLSGASRQLDLGFFSAALSSPNLTPDVETGLGSWTDGEIARAIREGLDKNGIELAGMPSAFYRGMSDADVSAVIGYLRSLPPVRNVVASVSLNLFAKATYALDTFRRREPEEPSSTAQRTTTPGTIEHGEYMLRLAGCQSCHGVNLAGGAQLFAEEGAPIPANLTPASDLIRWLEIDFIRAVRQGIRPDGGRLAQAMPRKQLSDGDLKAILLYLHSLPAITTRR